MSHTRHNNMTDHSHAIASRCHLSSGGMFAALRILNRALWFDKTILCRRRISTVRFDPTIKSFASEMAIRHPVFSVSPQHIRVLNQPPEFYSLLLEMIKRAEHRIFISSLYIGSDNIELLDAIEERLKYKPSLQVSFLLDLNRSTRPGPSSTAKLLLPLLEAYPSRVQAIMFRSPNLRGLMAKLIPPRFNEGWGTWHAKIYGVDNEVIISGANLNKSYFTSRQDRYLHFNDQPLLAQYCFDFLKAVAKFSFRLHPDPAPGSITPHSCVRDGYTLEWPDSETHPHNINEKARDILLEFQSSRRLASKIQLETSLDSCRSTQQVMLFPMIQAGQFSIREEESALQLLFRHVNATRKQKSRKRPIFDLTSGYFSLYKPYQKLLLGCRNVDCRIVAASPKANGFFGSTGLSGRIPEGYTFYEKRFIRAVRKAGRLWRETASGCFKGVQLLEWAKPGWTYHAKGIWLSPCPKSLPIMTLFGSTNLNSRSAHLDTELSFAMVIPSCDVDPIEGDGDTISQTDASLHAEDSSCERDGRLVTPLSLREQLQHEIDNIRANASVWKGGTRKVRFTTKIFVWLAKGML